MDAAPTVEFTNDSVLKFNFLSHGTLESVDLEKTRHFYTDFLGLEVVRTSPISLMIRLGGTNTIAVVQNPKKKPLELLNHNGLDVATREDVDRCYQVISEQKEKWGIKKATKPVDQHGTYSFYFMDLDDNWWEVLTNPKNGYSWMFAKGRDIDNWGADDINPNEYAGRRFRKEKSA